MMRRAAGSPADCRASASRALFVWLTSPRAKRLYRFARRVRIGRFGRHFHAHALHVGSQPVAQVIASEDLFVSPQLAVAIA